MEYLFLPANRGIEGMFTMETGTTLKIRAEDIRKQPTGVHAKVTFAYEDRILAYSTFNIDRDEDRLRLSNSAFNMLPPPIRELSDKGVLKHNFDLFCKEGYSVWLNTQKAAYLVPLSEREAPSFLLKPYIIRGGGTILFGPPGRGKSYVALTISVCVENNISTLFPVEHGTVLFVNLERSAESLQRRLLNINTSLGIPADTPLLTLNARGKTLDDIRENIEDSVSEFDVKLVVLDSISRAGFGDLTDNRSVNRIIDVMNNSCDTWFGLAHSPRNDSSHVYGSIHFDAGADIVVQQVSESKEDMLGIGLNITKANDVGKSAISTLGFGFDDLGLNKIWMPKSHEFPELMEARPESTEDLIYNYLSEATSATTMQIANGIHKSRSTISTILNNDERYSSEQFGRERVYTIKSFF
tara:strand:+ start:3512 stop:4747 length:1236 start_codon:yes stop_codon:yes gene_type:complete